jgi:hypothetical protein
MGIERESCFVTALIADLNSNMYIDVDPLPELARDTEHLAMSASLIFALGAHAVRLAKVLYSTELKSFIRGGCHAGKKTSSC